jgi:putative membrane protein
MLSAADHKRIAEAVIAAEAKTSGEIFCIATQEVSQYRETPLAVAAGAALILPPLLALLGLHPWTWAQPTNAWAIAPTQGVEAVLAEAIGLYALAQTVLFALVLIFASLKDRQVEIVADKAIHDAVGEPAWDAAVAALTSGMKTGDPASGFVLAIEICGDALAAHFPAQGPHENRFPDGVVEV